MMIKMMSNWFRNLFILTICKLHFPYVETALAICPCEKATDSSSFVFSLPSRQYQNNSASNHDPLVLCILPTGMALETANMAFLSSLSIHHSSHSGLRISLLSENQTMHKCNVLIRLSNLPISSAYNNRILCPGSCQPVPEVDVPNDLLFQNSYSNIFETHKEFPLTCSLTIEMILHKRQKMENLKISKRHDLSFVLKEIFFRRLYECYEHVKIPKRVRHHHLGDKTSIPHGDVDGDALVLRKLKALVIWIGTASNLKLIKDQSDVLGGQPNYGIDAVIAWAATDDLYNCNENTTQCHGGNGRFKYLPHSAINVNKFGWRCAQRRPLRALAHVLQLFDPSVVVLLDDDTYLNYPLLIERFGAYIFGDMMSKPIYMGEFIGKTGVHGHLSLEGIFAGGSGYILGHKALQLLNNKAVRHFGFEGVGTSSSGVDLSDGYRSDPQVRHLSLLAEAMAVQHGGRCPQHKGSSCMPTLKDMHESQLSQKNSLSPFSSGDLFVPIGVRLIDLCTNLMANEHACHHRCVRYNRAVFFENRKVYKYILSIN